MKSGENYFAVPKETTLYRLELLSCSEAVVATSPTHGVHYSNIHGIPVMQNITF